MTEEFDEVVFDNDFLDDFEELNRNEALDYKETDDCTDEEE